MRFAYRTSAVAQLPPLGRTHALACSAMELRVLPEGPYLLLDHRGDIPDAGPARVEFWDCTSAGEGPMAGLFLVSPPRSPGPADAPASWTELARALTRAPRQPVLAGIPSA